MPADRAIRIVLVDDHFMVRQGLAALIAGFDDLILVGEASSGAEALRLCSEQQPDVVLMDLLLPGESGIEVTRAILKDYPGIRVLALTSSKDERLLQEALKAGFTGFLLKDASVDELVNALRTAYQGRPTLDWRMVQIMLAPDRAAPARDDAYDLTAREVDILTRMATGLTNRQIAVELGISHHTVNAHVSNILSKLGVASRTEAVALAYERKLLDVP